MKIKKKTNTKNRAGIRKISRARLVKQNSMKPAGKREMVLILDFGSQYTQLIARRVRENHVYSQIAPYNISAKEISEISPMGIILSGGPASVYQTKALPDKDIFKLGIPVLESAVAFR